MSQSTPSHTYHYREAPKVIEAIKSKVKLMENSSPFDPGTTLTFLPGLCFSYGQGTAGDNSKGKKLVYALLSKCPTARDKSWVAGHIISHSFGGPDSEDNYVPLTCAANSLHSSIEAEVYQAAYSLQRYYQNSMVLGQVRKVVMLRYTVNPIFIPTVYEGAAPERLVINTEYVGWDVDRKELLYIGGKAEADKVIREEHPSALDPKTTLFSSPSALFRSPALGIDVPSLKETRTNYHILNK